MRKIGESEDDFMEERKSLKDKAKSFTGLQIPFMEGKEKGETKELIGKVVTIDNFGFINGDDGEYVVFTVKEIKNEFFFGGSVLTQNMKELENEGYRDEIESDGLPVLFTEKRSKNKRTYTAVEFYPEN